MVGTMSLPPDSLPTLSSRAFTAEPVPIAGAELTPEGRITAIQWSWGRLVWTRPTAILVRKGHSEERLQILDVTRVAQIAMLTMSVVLWAVGLIIARRKGQRERERRDG